MPSSHEQDFHGQAAFMRRQAADRHAEALNDMRAMAQANGLTPEECLLSVYDARSEQPHRGLYDIHECSHLGSNLPISVSEQDLNDPQDRYTGPFEGLSSAVISTLNEMREQSCLHAKSIIIGDGISYCGTESYYGSSRRLSLIASVVPNLVKLSMLQHLLMRPDDMWTPQTPTMIHVHRLKQPQGNIVDMDGAMDAIDQIQHDAYKIPMDYISRLEIHTRTHLTQIARYTKLDSDTTALDGKGGNNVLTRLADKMDFVLDMILTVYKLGKELGSTNMNLKTQALIVQCEGFRQRFFEDRNTSPRDLDVHIMNLSRKIRKLFNGDEQDHDSDVPTSQPSNYLLNLAALYSERIKEFNMRREKWSKRLTI